MSDQYKMVKHIGFVYVLDGCVVNGHNTIVAPSSPTPKKWNFNKLMVMVGN
jgi:hypothetical protein